MSHDFQEQKDRPYTLTSLPYLNKKKDENFLQKIAKTSATVLLLGESGTGKSNLAKNLHRNSLFSQGPFVEIQCTSIPENLVESELFGHEKGSFTGAHKLQMGKAEQADGGTLFLDEIGELNLSSQAKLLKLMQDKVVTRIGSSLDIKIATRIIVATNRNLLKMVKEGQLRSDLYYRMNIFEVELETLNKRKGEIFSFIEEFIIEFNNRENTQISYLLNPELKKALIEYSWPGNIRELKNVIERLCYLCEDDELDICHLPECIISQVSKGRYKDFETDDCEDMNLTLKDVEKRHIEKALKCQPNLELTAQALGITTVTLWRKRKEYNLM